MICVMLGLTLNKDKLNYSAMLNKIIRLVSVYKRLLPSGNVKSRRQLNKSGIKLQNSSTKSSDILFQYTFVILNVQLISFNERFVSFVNELNINVSFRSLTETSVDFLKLPFVNGTLSSPIPNNNWTNWTEFLQF